MLTNIFRDANLSLGYNHRTNFRVVYLNLPVTCASWKYVSTNFVLEYNNLSTKRFYMVFIDRFSKIVHFILCQNINDVI